MNYDEVLRLVLDVAVKFRRAWILSVQGKNKEYREAFRELTDLGTKCLENNVYFCFFTKQKVPMPDSQYCTVTDPLENNWPQGSEKEIHSHDDGAIHVHVTFVYNTPRVGLVETHPEGFDVDFVTFPKHIRPHSSSEPKPGDPTKEGGLLSPEDMKRFLTDQGLANLADK